MIKLIAGKKFVGRPYQGGKSNCAYGLMNNFLLQISFLNPDTLIHVSFLLLIGCSVSVISTSKPASLNSDSVFSLVRYNMNLPRMSVHAALPFFQLMAQVPSLFRSL